MKTLFLYIRPKFRDISIGLTIKFGGTVAELLLPWMLSVILDDYVPQGNLHQILLWGGRMILCSLLALAGNVVANRMSTLTSRDITRALRYDLFSKITSLSRSQEDAFTTPSLISRLTSDTYNIHQMVDRMQRLGVRAPILLIGGIFITFLMEPVLTLILIATLPLLAILVFVVFSRGVKMYTKTQDALDSLLRRAQESMNGIRVIQALSKTEYECARFEEANIEVITQERRAGMLMNITSPVMNLIINVGLAVVIIAGAYRVNAGMTQSGTIIAFLSYFTIILNAVMMVSRLFAMYSKGAASARRVAQVLEAPVEMTPVSLPAKENDAFLRFDHVSFSYGKVRDDISDISFSLRKGETLGIIGPTGCGKTTILQLILRFYDPDSGTVSIDGRDVRSISPKILHTLFGVVFQNDFLYAGPLGENIDFGRELTEAQILAAAQTAQADFIHRRDGGLYGEIASKGADLSGGQKQRMLIARALAGHPEILLLDDCSSALDYKTDAALRHALASKSANVTKVIVAQRISTIKDADYILVLDGGCVLGYGTHEELLKSCESYKEIADIQMGEVE